MVSGHRRAEHPGQLPQTGEVLVQEHPVPAGRSARGVKDFAPHAGAAPATDPPVGAFHAEIQRLLGAGKESSGGFRFPYLVQGLGAEVSGPVFIQHIKVAGVDAAIRLHDDLILTLAQQSARTAPAKGQQRQEIVEESGVSL